ncbi:hypothetical protein CHS0354_014444 [Potamilus streckersoni]|nr:hypothetical protein CHS0354_014444 [Potamilus streckersoni]
MAYNHNVPENCRLFILVGKGIKEDAFREAFGKYGKIEDVWVVKDRRSNEDKGVVYITFSRASEAALAMQEMNGRVVPGHPKPIKVLIANSKRDGSVRDPHEDEKILRLFLIIPKSMSEDELRREFEQYGDIDYATVLRDKNTGESKGFGYVKFFRPYHAALALENCDRSFKPKFAEPKMPRGERDNDYEMDYQYSRDTRPPGAYPRGPERGPDRHERGTKRCFSEYSGRDDYHDDGPPRSRFSHGPLGQHRSPDDLEQRNDEIADHKLVGEGPMEMIQNYVNNGCQRLHVTAPLGLTQQYLTRLFNLIPGLEYCDLNEATGIAYVRYATPQCAAYAKDKLDGFEYPLGSRLIVRFADAPNVPDLKTASAMNFENYGIPGSSFERDESDTIRKAALILEKAGINPDRVLASDNSIERVTYCNIMLPLPKPLSPEDSSLAQRLFIVCQPAAVPERILRDAFCRFGDLIDVYLLSGRNYGYAKYASKECAMKAISVLHGQSIAGQRLKVLEAEPPKEDNRREGRDRHDSHSE